MLNLTLIHKLIDYSLIGSLLPREMKFTSDFRLIIC